LKHESSR